MIRWIRIKTESFFTKVLNMNLKPPIEWDRTDEDLILGFVVITVL